jgi:catalase
MTYARSLRCTAAACAFLALGQPVSAQNSTLPPGVHPVSPHDAMSIVDPEQLYERTPGHLIQDMHAAFGAHQARAVHAKGTILQGWFEPATGGPAISYAKLFLGRTPVVVRFSDFTGIPDIPDNEKHAQPRGLAVKFLLPDGSNFDVVTHSFNGFPVATSGEFGDLLQAIGASGPDAQKPTPIERYLDGHPIAKRFLTTQTPPPASWATTTFFGVNAYQFVNASGRARFVRYRFVPEAGEHYLTDAELAHRSPDYLAREIAERVGRGPVRFAWYAQVAAVGDPIQDPSLAWPDSRRLIKLGTLVIDRVGPNSALADKSVAFLPGTTTRNAAYEVSFHERQ